MNNNNSFLHSNITVGKSLGFLRDDFPDLQEQFYHHYNYWFLKFAMTLLRVKNTRYNVPKKGRKNNMCVLSNAFYMSFTQTRQGEAGHGISDIKICLACFSHHQNLQSEFCFVILKNRNVYTCSSGFKLVYITF